jgi:aspartate dehydrogenase
MPLQPIPQLLAVVVRKSCARALLSLPSENPKTGRITALSVIAYLRKQGSALRVGT